MMRSPIRLSDSDVPIIAAPLPGQHTAQVLQEELGLSELEITALMQEKIVAGVPDKATRDKENETIALIKRA